MMGKRWMGFLGAVGTMGIGLAVGMAGAATAQTQPPPPRPEAVTLGAEAQPTAGDVAITAAIKDKLLSNVLLRNAQITIATTNGVVTLVGMVHSDTARTQALDAARSTPGVVRIDDMLRLDVSSPQAPSQN